MLAIRDCKVWFYKINGVASLLNLLCNAIVMTDHKIRFYGNKKNICILRIIPLYESQHTSIQNNSLAKKKPCKTPVWLI